jgi:hypothetical protein
LENVFLENVFQSKTEKTNVVKRFGGDYSQAGKTRVKEGREQTSYAFASVAAKGGGQGDACPSEVYYPDCTSRQVQLHQPVKLEGNLYETDQAILTGCPYAPVNTDNWNVQSTLLAA